ncbi:dnaJ homolog subfamily A member 3, mitochondrial-like isoform X2 [Halichondria panicea]|uniref:dnaJ homolog subfamily A member 3, mitochondrial-like isoform X2 n=1 Tax=Halichondria panicea TaxID=6063 RepID=UPI00312BAAC8
MRSWSRLLKYIPTVCHRGTAYVAQGVGNSLACKTIPNRRVHGCILGCTSSTGMFQGCRAIHTSGSSDKDDYYNMLGVPRSAGQKEIKKAYYELAKKYHPDLNKDNPDAAKRFTEIGEAYEVLSDQDKRNTYDATGHSEYTAGSQGASSGFTSSQAEEIFKSFFGGGGFGNMFEQGASTHRIGLTLSFNESVSGCTKDISLRVQGTCGRCFGTGGEPGTKEQMCPYCRGKGEEVINTGLFHMKSTCRRCHGQGKIITTPCHQCSGTGTTVRAQSVNVQVPAGVADGQTLRVPVGQSEAYVVLKVTDSDLFERDGFDVHSDTDVSFTQAILGGELKIPGLSGHIMLKIPAGVQSHHRIKLTNRGIPQLNGYGKGDHYVHVKISIPKRLTKQQRELITEYALTENLVNGTVNGLDKERRTKMDLPLSSKSKKKESFKS